MRKSAPALVLVITLCISALAKPKAAVGLKKVVRAAKDDTSLQCYITVWVHFTSIQTPHGVAAGPTVAAIFAKSGLFAVW